MIKQLLFVLLLPTCIAHAMFDARAVLQHIKEAREKDVLEKFQEQFKFLEEWVIKNDMPQIAAFLKNNSVELKFIEYARKALQKLSIKHKKPHILIFACSQPGMADSVALHRWATSQEDLTIEQVDTYYDALDLIKKRKQCLAQFHHKVLAQASAGGKKLFKDIQNVCKEYLPHTEHHLNTQRMHPELEKAIVDGDLNKVIECINQGYDLRATTADYRDALELATERGQADIFRELIKHLPYINPQKQKVLLTYAKKDMIPVITKELPEYIAGKNEELTNRGVSAARMLALLLSGANPNTTTQRDFFIEAQPMICRILSAERLPHLKVLLKHSAHVNSRMGLENSYSLAEYASLHNNAKALKILLEHGANANAYTSDSWPMTARAIHDNDSECLKVLLEHGANPNDTFSGSSLLKRAEQSKKKDDLIPLLKRYGARYTTLEKYPELIGVPAGICAGVLINKAQGYPITSTEITIMGAGSMFGYMLMRVGSALGSLIKN